MSVYDYLSNLSSLFLIIAVSKKHTIGHNAENIIQVCKNVFLYFSIATNAKTGHAGELATKDRKKVQVSKDQEKAQSERDSQPKNRGGKKTN